MRSRFALSLTFATLASSAASHSASDFVLCDSHPALIGRRTDYTDIQAMTTNGLDSDVVRNLIATSHEAKRHAYSPYSGYAVGAALLTTDDKIFTGCNVENSSYGLSICAERTALTKAVSEGHRTFKAIAVATNDNSRFSSPCGACRQFLAEFGLEYDVYVTKPDLSYRKSLVKDLLPNAFVPDDLAVS